MSPIRRPDSTAGIMNTVRLAQINIPPHCKTLCDLAPIGLVTGSGL